jgi:hypothetical protein
LIRDTIRYLAELFIAIFIAICAVYIFGFFGFPIEPSVTEFFIETAPGMLLMLFVGMLALGLSILMVVFWEMDNKWKDLRYKMAFFLYHSRVKNGDRIPLQYLAKVAVCSLFDITKTLENMIARNELKGIVDRERGIYIHKGLTRRGMKFLVALPPAGVSGLQEVKKYALKGHVWNEEGEEDIEELEEVEIEELPSAQEILEKRERHKVKCPHCGRMNIKEHQFCTFCGEVI